MFIPRGDVIYESLATSYVLVDALVADLCEGGFSGIVEVVLRDTDSFVVIAVGNVAAVLEKGGRYGGNGASATYTRTTVEQLATRSRKERGRVSIYSYSPLTASAVAGRLKAQSLYIGLSTEFTDLEKMISKLSREHDREWFIEINREDGTSALLHMRDAQCAVISSRGATDSGPLDLSGHAALARLVDECTRAGGTFDVYFKLAGDPVEAASEKSPLSVSEYPETPDFQINQEVIGSQLSALEHPPSAFSISDESLLMSIQEQLIAHQDAIDISVERSHRIEAGNNGAAPASTIDPESTFANVFSEDDFEAEPSEQETQSPVGLSLVRDELLTVGADADAMNDIKRLMGEVARVIEEAAQAVARPDSFSMSLRSGQLKIADRYPFLDPFAGEFEYLTGEIVFVGRASASEFVTGFAEALKIAVQEVARSTAYADRFCSYVIEDLNKLLTRERAEFEKYGIDNVIKEIVS
jgi:hypothetical protein